MNYCDVLLPVPLTGYFTYRLPPELATLAQAGCRVVVPFGNKKTTTGLIVRVHQTAPQDSTLIIKDITELVDTQPVILPGQLAFWEWIASYYLCSVGEVFKAAIPGKMKKVAKKKIKARAERIVINDEGIDLLGEKIPLSSSLMPQLPVLSPAQQSALDSIRASWQQHSVCLLHGVTSSGKTEIYTHLIAEALQRREQVLYLLPEIVLTSQLTTRLKTVFGDHLGVYHSKYSDAQRAEVWMRQLSAEPYDIIVGVRSSVFLPFQRLGLVIVDEEHETSFKQQEPAPRYHARNAAIMLATRTGARTLLGTATPSFESYYNARIDKYGLVKLTERFGQVQLPEVEVIDIKELQRKRLMQGAFSPALLQAMREALDAGEQVILFQNRRGFAPSVSCHVCGWVPRCPHCDVPLTLHKRTGHMTCHYCGFTAEIPGRCPACENSDLRGRGYGTERIEDEIQKHFPSARIARMDLDTTRTRTAYEALIQNFASGETDVLIGTQMVTKGLDFERVSVVGILSAETMLNQPDFRAYERSFQMLAQVAGRAGRRQHRGRVFLQTFNADLGLIRQVVSNDYEGAYQEQMLERRQFAYPPFVHLVTVYVKHRHLAVVDALAKEITLRLRASFGTRVLGPDEPPIGRVASLFIRRIMLKLEPGLPMPQVHELLSQLRKDLLGMKTYASALFYFDVDPLS